MSNANKVKQQAVTVELNKERHLRYTLNAFVEMEERYDSVDKALDAVKSNDIKAIIFIIWCGLMHEDETLTEKQVGNLIDITQLQEIIAKLTEAIGGSLPEEKVDTAVELVSASPNA